MAAFMIEVRALVTGPRTLPGWWPLPFTHYATREEAEAEIPGWLHVFGGTEKAAGRVVPWEAAPGTNPLATGPIHREPCPYCGGEKWSTDAHCGCSACSQRYIDDVDGTVACTGCGTCYGDASAHATPED